MQNQKQGRKDLDPSLKELRLLLRTLRLLQELVKAEYGENCPRVEYAFSQSEFANRLN